MSCESFKINWRFMCFELNDTEKCRGIILYKYLVFGTGPVFTGQVWCLQNHGTRIVFIYVDGCLLLGVF